MSQSAAEELNRKEEITKFLNSYTTSSKLHDASVKQMRHHIPLLLMEVYSDKYGQYTKKVKGLWEKRPDDWPADVPFVDPNNKLKNEGEKNCKPKKELLGQMLAYLIDRFQEKQKGERALKSEPFMQLLSNPGYPTTDNQFFLDLMESEEPSNGQAMDQQWTLSDHNRLSSVASNDAYSSVGQTSSFLAFDPDEMLQNEFDMLNPCNLMNQFSGSMQSHVEEPIGSPEQVMDNEDLGEDWEPLNELILRIPQKLRFMKKQKFLNGDDFASMEARYNKLKETARDPASCCSVIDDLHLLEKEIDVLKFSKRASNDNLCEKNNGPLKNLEELKDESTFKFVDDDASALPLMKEVPIAVEDPKLMSSLNIKTRLGLPASSGTVTNLTLRSLPASEAQDTSVLKSSVLSENHKPVQSAIDDLYGLEELLKDLPPLKDFPGPLEDEVSPPAEDMTPKPNVSDDGAINGRIFTPVQETGNTCLAASEPGTVNNISAVGGSFQVIYENGVFRLVEIGNALSFAPTEAQNSMIRPAGFFGTTTFAGLTLNPAPPPQLPVVVTQPQSFPAVIPQPVMNNRGQVRPGGKRAYPFEDDNGDVEMVDMTAGQSAPSPDNGGHSALIPTMVEQMSDNLYTPISRGGKKYRKTP